MVIMETFFIEFAILAIKIRPVILTQEYSFAHGANNTINSFEKASCIVMTFQRKINPEFNKKELTNAVPYLCDLYSLE